MSHQTYCVSGVASPGPVLPLTLSLLIEHPVWQHSCPRSAAHARHRPPPACHRPHGPRHRPRPRGHRGARGHRPRARLWEPRAAREVILVAVVTLTISSGDLRLLGDGAVGAGPRHGPHGVGVKAHDCHKSQLQRTTRYTLQHEVRVYFEETFRIYFYDWF